MAAFTLRAISRTHALQQRGSYSINSLAVESCPTPRHGSTSGERVDLLENFDLGHQVLFDIHRSPVTAPTTWLRTIPELLPACGDAAKMLDLIEEALDQITLLVDVLVVGDGL